MAFSISAHTFPRRGAKAEKQTRANLKKDALGLVLVTSGKLRKPLETVGNLRKPPETVGNLRKPSETFGNLRGPPGTFGDPSPPPPP